MNYIVFPEILHIISVKYDSTVWQFLLTFHSLMRNLLRGLPQHGFKYSLLLKLLSKHLVYFVLYCTSLKWAYVYENYNYVWGHKVSDNSQFVTTEHPSTCNNNNYYTISTTQNKL